MLASMPRVRLAALRLSRYPTTHSVLRLQAAVCLLVGAVSGNHGRRAYCALHTPIESRLHTRPSLQIA